MQPHRLGHRLTATDAAFLYYERPEAAMAIGAVGIVDGEVDRDRYAARVGAKVSRVPRMRQRVMSVPYGIGHPTWEPDPDFDVANHVLGHELEPPGDLGQFRRFAERLISPVLDRQKPLWEVHLVRGLEGGRSAFVSKVHHAMVDGVGGNELMTTLLDLEPDPTVQGAAVDPVPGLPDASTRMVEAFWDSLRGGIDSAAEGLRAVTELGRRFSPRGALAAATDILSVLPDLALPPRLLPFNRPCSGQRRLGWSEMSFAEARAIRSAVGGTVNDVVLTTLAGAIRRYLRRRHRGEGSRSLRVMVPVNVRPAAEKAALGNLVSMLPVTLPLDVNDPVERLRTVSGRTARLKDSGLAEVIGTFADMAGLVPPPLQAAIGAVAAAPVPLFNMVCSNTPGPQIPLYLMGRRLLSYHPYLPLGYNLGLACVAFSYNQTLFVTLVGDAQACPDVGMAMQHFEDEFAALKLAAGVRDIAEVPTRGWATTVPQGRELPASTGVRRAARRVEGVPGPRGSGGTAIRAARPPARR